MAIQNPTPIVVEVSEPTVYDSFWATRLMIQAPSPTGNASAFIELVPYSIDAQKTLNDVKRIHIKDLWKTADEKPEVAQAISSILSAINVIVNS